MLLYIQELLPIINRAGWMKGICHVWSRGRHFSPSLPGDRYLKLGSKSDLRAEISGSIVRYDALAPRSEVLLLWYFVGACAATLNLKFFPYSWRKYPHRVDYQHQKRAQKAFALINPVQHPILSATGLAIKRTRLEPHFVKVNTNGKLETRTKGIVDKCSDLTCTKKYALTQGPKPGGGGAS